MCLREFAAQLSKCAPPVWWWSEWRRTPWDVSDRSADSFTVISSTNNAIWYIHTHGAWVDATRARVLLQWFSGRGLKRCRGGIRAAPFADLTSAPCVVRALRWQSVSALRHISYRTHLLVIIWLVSVQGILHQRHRICFLLSSSFALSLPAPPQCSSSRPTESRRYKRGLARSPSKTCANLSAVSFLIFSSCRSAAQKNIQCTIVLMFKSHQCYFLF